MAVEQAGAGQHPSAGVDATDSGKAGGDTGKIADKGGGCHLGLAKACDDDQGIGTFGRGERAHRGQFDAAGEGCGLARGGDHTPTISIAAKVAIGRAQRVENTLRFTICISRYSPAET